MSSVWSRSCWVPVMTCCSWRRTPSGGGVIFSAWPAATAPRRWSPPSRPATASRSSSSPPARATTSRWTSASEPTSFSSLSAFVDGVDVRVDLAEINGRVFVNNASMGVYAELVRSPHYRGAKVRTAVELLPDLVGPSAAPVDLRYRLPSGEQATTAQVLLVSNNPYQLSALPHGAGRPRLDGGVLGVVSVRVPDRAGADALAKLDATAQNERFRGGRSGRRRGSTSRRGSPSPWESTARRSPWTPRCTS